MAARRAPQTTWVLGNINPGQVAFQFLQSVLAVMQQPDTDVARLVEFAGKHHGPYLDVGRNMVVERFLAHPDRPDVLLFVDSDMEFTPDQAHGIVAKATPETPVVGGLYVNLFPQHGIRPVALNWDMELAQPLMLPIPMPDVDAGMIEVDCVGTGFMAIHRTVLERLSEVFDAPAPWFAELVLHGSQMGEDVTFCERVRALGFPVLLDCSVQVGHLKNQLLLPATFMAGAEERTPVHV